MGIPYHHNFISYFDGEHKSEKSMKLNPCGTVPYAINDDGQCITESNAILMYAADQFGPKAEYPQDLQQRAQVNRWLFWESSVWFRSCYVLLIENNVKPHCGLGETDQKAVEDEMPNFKKLAEILDKQLAKHKWIAGEQITIADISIAASAHQWAAAKMHFEDYPNLKRWMTEGIEKLPVWQKTQEPVTKAFGENKPRSATNGANGTNGASSGTVKATLNYTKNLEPDKLTELYFYESEKAKDIHEPGDDPHEMTFHDGWGQAKAFSVDKHGFAVSGFSTSYADWEDEEKTRDTFYPEIVEFLKQTLGAKRVLVFDHTIRTAKNQAKKLTQETNTSQRAPVMLVHCDYTAESGPLRVKQLLGDEADDLLSRRVAFINVWKPLNKVEERPLAMCDATTVPQDDFFKLHLRYRDRNGENYVMSHSEKQKWWYFPGMTPDKVILLKTFDNEEGVARFVGHSAFEDPTSSKDAPMRESCEIRTICFF